MTNAKTTANLGNCHFCFISLLHPGEGLHGQASTLIVLPVDSPQGIAGELAELRYVTSAGLNFFSVLFKGC